MRVQLKQTKFEKSNTGEAKLQEEMDFWVKDFEKKIQRTEELELKVDETKQNTDFNYELIRELQLQVKELRKDVDKIKHYTFIAMKSRPLKSIGSSDEE